MPTRVRPLLCMLHALAAEMEYHLTLPEAAAHEEYNIGMLDAYLNVISMLEDKEFKGKLKELLVKEGWLNG